MTTAMTHTENDKSDESIEVAIRHFVSGSILRSPLRADWSVDRARLEIVREAELPLTDSANRAQHYELFLRRRDGSRERLNPSSRIGDVVREGDELEPLPEVKPGRVFGG